MAKAKERLTPIPRQKRKPPRPVPQSDREGSGFSAAAEARGPDLSHIAPGLLRPEVVALADLAFMTGNAVRHPERQVAEIQSSIRQFSQLEALIVNRRTSPAEVIGGNGRLQAMLAAGYTHAAVVYVDLPPEKAALLSVALNRTADGRQWDQAALDRILADVRADDSAAGLLDDPALREMMERLEKELKPCVRPEADRAGGDQPAAAAEPERLGVVVECRDAGHQRQLVEQLTAAGEACRGLTFTEKVRLALAK